MRALLRCAAFLGMVWVSCSADAEDLWGCEVLLCLSNPAGPEAVAECQPPIQRLWRHLRDGHPFPSCPSADGAYARATSSYYDLCPAGTTELPMGQFGATLAAPRFVYAGIGDGGILAQGSYSQTATALTPFPPKVCVGRKLSQGIAFAPIWNVDQWGSQRFEACVVGYYEQVTLLPAQRSANVIDVYIDNVRYKRVRW